MNDRPRHHRKHAFGFTLIEFLIALALVALIMVMLTGGLYLGSRSWEAVDGKTEQVGEVRHALEFVRRQLGAARSATYIQLEENKETLLFHGSREMLEWVAPLPEYVGHGGLSVMRLAIAERDDNRQLIFERWLFHPDVLEASDADWPAWSPLTPVADRISGGPVDSPAYGRHVLIESLDHFELAYFGAAEEGKRAVWQSDWRDVGHFPTLVQIEVRRGGEAWPKLVVEMPDPVVRFR